MIKSVYTALLFLLSFQAFCQAPIVWINEDGEGFSFEVAIFEDDCTILLTEKGQIDFFAHDAGKIDYYVAFGDGTNGQIRTIGSTEFVYYYDFDNRGKIETAGEMLFEYNEPFTGDMDAGKVHRIGDYEIEYYLNIDGDDKRGKISKIGNITFDYFYGGPLAGKVRSVGGYEVLYFGNVGDVRLGRIRLIRGEDPSVKVISRL